MIQIQDLSFVREENPIFSQLNFKLEPGNIIQIAGPNGAGKTSLLRVLAGLARADSGQVLWQQQSAFSIDSDYFSHLLYIGHQAGVRGELSPVENLRFLLSLSVESHISDSQLESVLETVGLAGYEDTPAAQLSAGQHRRVALARLWLSNKQIWILDEPFTAIDKQGVANLEALILAHAQAGGIVILTTHQDLGLSKSEYQIFDLSEQRQEHSV